jgi:hypothetical protein
MLFPQNDSQPKRPVGATCPKQQRQDPCSEERRSAEKGSKEPRVLANRREEGEGGEAARERKRQRQHR